MTTYKQQTDITKTKQGELAILNDNQLATVDASNNQVNLSNPDVIGEHDHDYVASTMDIAIAQTMTDANGNSIVFLNTNSYDSTAQSSFEFEEADGRVYSLYTRTSGVGQELFYGSAKDSKQLAQLSVFKYAPSWLTGTGWVASHCLGGDCNGFCLVLSNPSQPLSQTTVRYVYVKLTTNSLIDVANHQYVEITPFVRTWVNGLSGLLQNVNHMPLVRRGQYHTYVEGTDSIHGFVYLGGFVNDDVTYPFTSAVLPASPAAFTPTQVTFTKANWYDGSTETSTALRVLTNTAGNPVRVISSTGTVLTGNGTSLPYSNQLPTNPNSMCFEVANNGTTEVLGFITPVYVYYTNSAGHADSMNSTVGVTFTRSGTGAAVTLTYVNPDPKYGQPYPWTLMEISAGKFSPQETVNSNFAQPLTCANKLPALQSYIINGAYEQMVQNSFYSGNGAVTVTGAGGTNRAAFQYLAGQGGSLAQAQLAKFTWMYPNLNVSPRMNFVNGTNIVLGELAVPSGREYYANTGFWIGANTALIDGYVNGPDVQGGKPGFAVAVWPSGSVAGARTLYSGTNQCACFPPRISENIMFYNGQQFLADGLVRVGVCYTNGGNINTPVQSIGTLMFWNYDTSSGAKVTGGVPTFAIGQFTQNPTTKQWSPPNTTTYTYSASINTQIQQAGTALVAAAGQGDTIRNIELFPVLDSTGAVPTRMFGFMYSTNGTTLRGTSISVGLTISGSVISVNPADVTLIGSSSNTHNYSASGAVWRSTVQYQVWTSATAHYFAYYGDFTLSYPGDALTPAAAMVLNGNSATSQQTVLRGARRHNFSLSPQHQGLASLNPNDAGQQDGRTILMRGYYAGAVNTAAGLAASIQAAVSGTIQTPTATGIMAIYDLTAIQNNEILQIGSVSGNLNGKIFNLPSTYYDLTGMPTGTYYIYVVDNGMNIAFKVVQDNTILEAATSMYLGRVDKTSSGFANGVMVASLIRFGTARLAQGHTIAPIAGSSIRWGAYPMPSM